ncbi:methylated-DNA--[protein]-cysteine S-methyltransferase [Companilactobacillus metriopterae]|uniref:methylated-DNA--[protein]-cysteine S-methyltransferase n=1 Tax=Companilactobacillus metriopterae TaxID=1909267 RepID=UPI00100B57FB|nr:methylated-DNA--[protein]-cysteine S-methyltransferase [Companilactobacillus metriopterae]
MNIYFDSLNYNNNKYFICVTDNGINFIGSPNQELEEVLNFYPEANLTHRKLDREKQEISEYLAGERKKFDLPIDLVGTEFQMKVWNAIRSIPYGKTITYLEIANMINNPKAIRAVGTAVGRNPILMIIPCHRVIRSDGIDSGYRGGLAMKKELLILEKRG